MPLRHDHAGSPEGSGRAQHGADILRVGNLIEHKQNAFGRHVLKLDRWQELSLEHHALMHGVRSEQPVELSRQRILGLDAAGLYRGFEPPCGIFGRKHLTDGPVRVGECCLHGVDAIEQNAVGIGRTPQISGLSVGRAKSALRLIFGAWQGGEDLSGVATVSAR